MKHSIEITKTKIYGVLNRTFKQISKVKWRKRRKMSPFEICELGRTAPMLTIIDPLIKKIKLFQNQNYTTLRFATFECCIKRINFLCSKDKDTLVTVFLTNFNQQKKLLFQIRLSAGIRRVIRIK